MHVELCDICKKNEADRKYKIKHSKRGMYVKSYGFSKWCSNVWTPWEKISICDECGKKFLDLPYVNKIAPPIKTV